VFFVYYCFYRYCDCVTWDCFKSSHRAGVSRSPTVYIMSFYTGFLWTNKWWWWWWMGIFKRCKCRSVRLTYVGYNEPLRS